MLQLASLDSVDNLPGVGQNCVVSEADGEGAAGGLILKEAWQLECPLDDWAKVAVAHMLHACHSGLQQNHAT